MKNLMYKEIKLALPLTSYIFLAFCTMLLIPSYPYYVAFFYTCLSIFFIFQMGREAKDTYYTAMLPVRKRDVVKARCLTIAAVELVQIIISVPFAILTNKINPAGSNQAGIEANVAFFGLVFVMFAVFNSIMIPKFYKDAYSIGASAVVSFTAVFVYIAVAETIAAYIPSPVRTFLDTNDPAMMLPHLPVLFGGIVIWALDMVLVYKCSAKRFEKVDL